MATQTVDAMIPGGKATAAPPLGPALGPLGVNIGQVVIEINKKTAAFNGMQVPVKVLIDTDTKDFEISIGTPPASALILKEAGIEKGSGTPNTDKVADLLIPQIIKIAKMKEDAMLGKNAYEELQRHTYTLSRDRTQEEKQFRILIDLVNDHTNYLEIARKGINSKEKNVARNGVRMAMHNGDKIIKHLKAFIKIIKRESKDVR